jgi:hypothetical protein
MSPPKQLAFLPALLFMAALACGQDIHYNYERNADFAAYKSYQWVGIPSSAPGSQLIDESIIKAIDEQLTGKGFTQVKENADLQVGYYIVILREKNINFSETGGPGFWGQGFSEGGIGSVRGNANTIPAGTLVVDLYDSRRKQLIWRGNASKTVDLKKDPGKIYSILEKHMAKLFKNYPPQASR